MRSEEFDVVRQLISGRGPQTPEPTLAGRTLAPAPFREIDGEILARQYIAHRKFLESEASAQRLDASGSGEFKVPKLRGERRPLHPQAYNEQQPAGFFASLFGILRRR